MFLSFFGLPDYFGITVEHLVVVTHPDPIELEARLLKHSNTPAGAVTLGYYHDGHLIARGVVAETALDAITGLLAEPVSLALAAAEDDDGNIEARICLVLPVDPDLLPNEGDEETPEEAWRSSLPALPEGIETGPAAEGSDPSRPRLALLPIGNVVRGRKDRHHPDDMAADAREMLDNLVGGKAQDAIRKAIDDLLGSI